jgi:transcriptional repressor NrdR
VRQLEVENETEILSSKIGEIVMSSLEKLDKVAFVRFASVYKNFEKTDDFQKFIKKII